MNTRFLFCAAFVLLAVGCNQESVQNPQESSLQSAQPTQAVENATPQTTPTSEPKSAGELDFPTIPQIVLPDMIGTSKVQAEVTSRLASVIDPISGINVHPANCQGDDAFVYNATIINADDGQYTQVGAGNAITINADGSASGVGAGVVFDVASDGTGTITSDEGALTVEANGAGSWSGKHGVIELDGKGAGVWTGKHGVIENKGNGAGSWSGEKGVIENNGDGSGSWTGEYGVITNNGDGTGEIAGKGKVAMSPIPPLPPAGKFPLLNTLKMPENPCGFVISLSDQVLFDFDKSDLRPEGVAVIQKLAEVLKQIPEVANLKVGGHTDSKGADDYNQSLSERRANSVVATLKTHQISVPMTAIGYGESRPVAPNEFKGQDNPQGRQANRRVEIFVKTQ